MTSGVAQTCSVPIRKLELLSGELRLLKGAIEQLHGRFELLLSEIADLQREHEAVAVEFPINSDPASLHQVQVEEISDVLPDSQQEMRASVIAEPAPIVAPEVCFDTPPAIPDDAAAVIHSTTADPHEVDEPETVAHAPTIDEDQPRQPVGSDLPQPDEAAPPASLTGQSCALIVLDDHRNRRPQSRSRNVARWAAAAALAASILIVALASTGFAYGFSEFFSTNGR